MPALNLHPRSVYLADTAACPVLGAILIAAAAPLTTLPGWTLPPALLIAPGIILLPGRRST
ncbi:hypothetical protein N8D56_19515 [Devosia sp. A8/3-2]|nr:hypothetical protein N8D56_19515 [Devosia sp. A8/3-2]